MSLPRAERVLFRVWIAVGFVRSVAITPSGGDRSTTTSGGASSATIWWVKPDSPHEVVGPGSLCHSQVQNSRKRNDTATHCLSEQTIPAHE